MHVEVHNEAPFGWDSYVTEHPHATTYHRASVAGIGAKAFGLRAAYVTAYDSGKTIAGVLPLIEQSSVLFGRSFVSLPFVTYGGVLADSATVAAALVDRAAVEAVSRNARHIELRHTVPLPELSLNERLDMVSMALKLPNSESELSKQLGAKLRSQIRRGERENIELRWGGAECIPEFYRVFAPAMHAHGTPIYPCRFFHVAYDALRDFSSILVVKMRGRVHAAAFLVRHPKSIEVPWAVATAEAKHLSVNMRMYWEMLCYAVSIGVETFDFGRTRIDHGTYRFKEQWGAKRVQLYWQYVLQPGVSLPAINRANPKYAYAAAMWKRMPLWCARLLGARITRSLP